MRAADLDIHSLLEIDAPSGTVHFAGRRAIILDAFSMGLLRKHLADAVGLAKARAVLTRFGFAHGFRMAEAMRAELALDNKNEWRDAGGLIYTLQGHILLDPGSSDPMTPQGATLRASFEAEQHLLHLGRADEPACWMLSGIASGYISRTEGRPIYVLEDQCVAKGDPACHFRGQPLEAWGPGIMPFMSFADGEPLDAALRRITQELQGAERERAPSERPRAAADPEGFEAILARSPAMRRVRDLARRMAKVDSTVLIMGESGSGKERVARMLHDAGARAAGPFIAVNCGAIAESLLESELFGHARGAFTSAASDRAGLFEAASGGTLFLDEVGELPVLMQVKLLRALEERQVRRVGENRSRPVDARVVAATNRDLAADVAAGRFRRDLYYRLKVVDIVVPPLRDRREDILPLAQFFLERAAGRMKRSALRLTRRAEEALSRHSWPGNVRELENAMERAAALAKRTRVDEDDLPDDIRRGDATPPILAQAPDIRTLSELERASILAALAQHGGNQTRAAATLGIGVSTLYRKLRSYGVIAEDEPHKPRKPNRHNRRA